MANKKELYRVKFIHEAFPQYLFYIYAFVIGKSKMLDLYCVDDLLLDDNKPFIEAMNPEEEDALVPQWVLNHVYKDFKHVKAAYLSGENVIRIDKMNSVINMKGKTEDNVVHLKPMTPKKGK